MKNAPLIADESSAVFAANAQATGYLPPLDEKSYLSLKEAVSDQKRKSISDGVEAPVKIAPGAAESLLLSLDELRDLRAYNADAVQMLEQYRGYDTDALRRLRKLSTSNLEVMICRMILSDRSID